MKLLIVDDEELTREGLIASLDWESLGVAQILQADDGIHALNIAHLQKPDIILCDVRMPRMDGIQLVERLEEFLPDTSVIFMSGYSDKEYLKAAIKLKAINYVEKPLDPLEIKEAVLEAKERRQQKRRTRLNENLYSMETTSHLALLFTKPFKENVEKISQLTDELSLRLKPGSSFTTYIIKLKTNEPDSSLLSNIRNDFSDFLAHYHLQALYIQLHAIYHVFHIIGNYEPSSTAFNAIEQYLKEQFYTFGDAFIGRGETVAGVGKVYHSYTTAVVALQSSFFFEPGTILSVSDMRTSPATHGAGDYMEDITLHFAEALLTGDRGSCESLLKDLYSNYFQNCTLFPNQVKDLYYKLFMSINDSRVKLKLNWESGEDSTQECIIEHLENCFTYQELHQMLVSKTEHFFQSIDSYVPEDSTIFLIKDYISKNYTKDTLSIKEISDHVFLSASYMCTYFKNQTGSTLNQYLTEYRMEKAMQLLADVRFQIADISSKVGYSNGNYFSKSFKKFTGLSPSKYREKILK
ncbi:response regulator transcription factor [Clostridium sp. C105KSO13]|uniref:response regulator transcription factor n=1 Tax=Clostridium sp. C105KSO13 TaxID=1776045 RepID=UPI0007405FB1|nr:response regulator [Clostridium sp. C105KSO13]CUX36183.1 putative response regulatory protein [Clostridium sp. C105KSO13]